MSINSKLEPDYYKRKELASELNVKIGKFFTDTFLGSDEGLKKKNMLLIEKCLSENKYDKSTQCTLGMNIHSYDKNKLNVSYSDSCYSMSDDSGNGIPHGVIPEVVQGTTLFFPG
jgi:hypothetical protein